MPVARTPMPLSHRARWALAASAAVTFGLYLIPYGGYVVYPLLLISTLVHELGHGIASEIVGADFVEFKMWKDGSGVAMHTVPGSDAARAFISAGGLCGPAVAAAAMLSAAQNTKWARYALAAFGLALALALVLVVRNSFGAVFCGVLAAATLVIAIRANAHVAQVTLLFLAVQLALSVFSRGDYLFKQYAQTAQGRMPSDSQQMADAMGGAYWFWGGLCAVFSVAMLLVGAFSFWRGTTHVLQPKSSVKPSRELL